MNISLITILLIIIGGWFINGVFLAVFDDLELPFNLRAWLGIIPYGFAIYMFLFIWVLLFLLCLYIAASPFILFVEGWEGLIKRNNQRAK